jgi:hypothetical protein
MELTTGAGGVAQAESLSKCLVTAPAHTAPKTLATLSALLFGEQTQGPPAEQHADRFGDDGKKSVPLRPPTHSNVRKSLSHRSVINC